MSSASIVEVGRADGVRWGGGGGRATTGGAAASRRYEQTDGVVDEDESDDPIAVPHRVVAVPVVSTGTTTRTLPASNISTNTPLHHQYQNQYRCGSVSSGPPNSAFLPPSSSVDSFRQLPQYGGGATPLSPHHNGSIRSHSRTGSCLSNPPKEDEALNASMVAQVEGAVGTQAQHAPATSSSFAQPPHQPAASSATPHRHPHSGLPFPTFTAVSAVDTRSLVSSSQSGLPSLAPPSQHRVGLARRRRRRRTNRLSCAAAPHAAAAAAVATTPRCSSQPGVDDDDEWADDDGDVLSDRDDDFAGEDFVGDDDEDGGTIGRRPATRDNSQWSVPQLRQSVASELYQPLGLVTLASSMSAAASSIAAGGGFLRSLGGSVGAPGASKKADDV